VSACNIVCLGFQIQHVLKSMFNVVKPSSMQNEYKMNFELKNLMNTKGICVICNCKGKQQSANRYEVMVRVSFVIHSFIACCASRMCVCLCGFFLLPVINVSY
jgi:hypothetical protein